MNSRKPLLPPFEKDDELFSLPPPTPTTSPQSQAVNSTSSQPQTPPSTPPSQPQPKPTLNLPAFYQQDPSYHKFKIISPAHPAGFQSYLRHDLDMTRLNTIHQHLWSAGLPRSARALHHQKLIGRDIVVTEKADLHLLWQDKRIFVKPLPNYLLSHDVWKDFLYPDSDLAMEAYGFLLSYIWLLRNESDVKIAKEAGLIGQEMTWEKWTKFSATMLNVIDHQALSNVAPRYVYGELRLGRINMIYRFCSQTTSIRSLLRSYHSGYHSYTTFLQRRFAWVVSAVVYATIVLTAMQVGLATTVLRTNTPFQRACYGFTVFSILSPLIIGAFALFIVLVAVVLNWHYTATRSRQARANYPLVFYRGYRH